MPLRPLARGIAIEVGANIIIPDDHLVGAQRTSQGGCTTLPVGTWNEPICMQHSITSPSSIPSARLAAA